MWRPLYKSRERKRLSKNRADRVSPSKQQRDHQLAVSQKISREAPWPKSRSQQSLQESRFWRNCQISWEKTISRERTSRPVDVFSRNQLSGQNIRRFTKQADLAKPAEILATPTNLATEEHVQLTILQGDTTTRSILLATSNMIVARTVKVLATQPTGILATPSKILWDLAKPIETTVLSSYSIGKRSRGLETKSKSLPKACKARRPCQKTGKAKSNEAKNSF